MFTWNELEGFLLILARITSFVLVSPFFTMRMIPGFIIIGLSFVLGLVMFPVVAATVQMPVFAGIPGFVFAVVGEVLVGLTLGFAAALTFAAFQVAGELIDVHMGFAMASLFDAQGGSRTTLVGQYLYLIAVVLFIIIDGHHVLIVALAQSFSAIPPGGVVFDTGLVHLVVVLFTRMFALGFKIALPLIAVMLISDVSLSLVSRTVPQLNVFIIGFPLKAALGMATLAILLPALAVVVQGTLSQIEKDLMQVMGSFP